MSRGARSPVRVDLVGPSLVGGGAERALVDLAAGLQARGHAVRIVTVYGTEGETFPVPEGIPRVDLGLGGASSGPFDAARRNTKRLAALRAALRGERTDAVVSFLTEINVLTVLASGRRAGRVVVTEHGDPAAFVPWTAWRLLRRLTYRFAAALVTPSAGIASAFRWLPPDRRHVLPNVVPAPATVAGVGGRPPVVAGMGRLAREKGFDLLMRAFARAGAERPDWRLVVWGEGPDRDGLASLARELGIEGRVELPGWTPDPMRQLAGVSIFALASRSESFGNVLVQAMHAGAPVVAFDAPTGPREIVTSGSDGLLVPAEDVTALADALARLMDDPGERSRLAAAAQRTALRYTPEVVVPLWEDLLHRICG